MTLVMNWIVLLGLALRGALPLVITYFGTALLVRLARSRALIDVPNERSSHTVPTPKGGGVAVVAGVVGGWMAWRGSMTADMTGVLLPVVAMCAIGLWDDVRVLRPRSKMLLMLGAAACATYAERVVVVRDVPFVRAVDLDWVSWPLTLFWFACYPNAFNFMDGLNGIAAWTAFVSAATFALASSRVPHDGLFQDTAWGTALVCAGFLPWNFPKARIFLGDAGSLPLGLILAWLAVRANATGAMSFPASVLLLGPFLFDVTFTLVRRKRQGHVLGEAHKDHLYQRLSRLWGGSHAKASLAFAGMAVATGALALAYDTMSELGKLLSLVLPVACLLAFAALVQRVQARRSAAGER